MGFHSYVREEAAAMNRLHMRSVALAFSLFVFTCLLVTGGYRLVGHECAQEQFHRDEPVVAVRGLLCAPPEQRPEVSLTMQREKALQSAGYSVYMRCQRPCACVCSDANGNILGSESYLHAVYQLFSLGDGFV